MVYELICTESCIHVLLLVCSSAHCVEKDFDSIQFDLCICIVFIQYCTQYAIYAVDIMNCVVMIIVILFNHSSI